MTDETITVEEWDTRWWVIYQDARADFDDVEAREIANDETYAQFGPRPEDVAS